MGRADLKVCGGHICGVIGDTKRAADSHRPAVVSLDTEVRGPMILPLISLRNAFNLDNICYSVH